MRKIILFFPLFFLFINSNAQKLKEFSSDTNVYITQVKEFLEKNISKENDDFLDQFREEWKEGMYTNKERETIIKTSNLLLKKNFRPHPEFMDYLKLVDFFKKDTVIIPKRKGWQKCFEAVLTNRKITRTRSIAFLKFSTHLFQDTALMYKNTLQWKASNERFSFELENEQNPVVIFEDIDLTCTAKRSKIEIKKSSGRYYPLDNLWKGKEGLVTWERANYSKNDVFAELNSYEIKMNKSEYKADSVVFTNSFYFDTPLLGQLHDKVKYISETQKATYPRFESYHKRFDIPDFYPQIHYTGGFSMRGEKLVGYGRGDEKAKMTFYKKDGSIALRTSSTYFGFTPERIVGGDVAVSIPIEQDSIYHPSVFLTFRTKNRELNLLHNDRAISQAPVFNTYHNVDVKFENIIWEIDNPLIRFAVKRGEAEGQVSFESVNFFNMTEYERLQRIDYVHPLARIRNCADSRKEISFTASDLARCMRTTLSQARILCLEMSMNGFIDFDPETDVLLIRKRLYDYMKASVGKIDYDVMKIQSRVDNTKDNAVLDLRNYDLKINGVPEVFLSDSQNVTIFPSGKTITMQKDRNFKFNGTLKAGLFTFYGNDFTFKYDSFKIDMPTVDSLHMDIILEEQQFLGRDLLGRVNNTMEDLKGELLIDMPNNKSGIRRFSEFPVFKSLKNSFVYYDDPFVQNGVYTRDSFYFEVYPYTIDSLDNFSKQAMNYRGIFRSAGIFPAFEEELRLQPDQSLGFVRTAPPSGFPIYLGTGRYHDTIRMSNQGLRGNGMLEYLTSKTTSHDFLFHIDSMRAYARTFDIAQKFSGIQYPKVVSKNIDVYWLPYEDQLYASKDKDPFDIFDGLTAFHGGMRLEPTGLVGWGKMKLENAELNSNEFEYEAMAFTADTSDFKLKANEALSYTFFTKNVNSRIDFETKKGHFRSNEGSSRVDFTQNDYMSYLREFTWHMDKEELEMGPVRPQGEYTLGNIKEMDINDANQTGARFISTRMTQDSLSFFSPYSIYNLKENIIDASLVRYIKTADAAVFPIDGKVIIEKDARMKPLLNSKILADTLNRFHEIYDAQTQIEGRRSYRSEGKYDYIDENNKKWQLKMKSVRVDTAHKTIARGSIPETDHFELSPIYKYQGNVKLQGPNEFLYFDGAVDIAHNCSKVKTRWTDFETEINPRDIWIPIGEKPRDINKNRIYNSIYLKKDSIHLYPSFLSKRKYHSDVDLFSTHGFLRYDSLKNTYFIGSKEKILNPDTTGNLYSFHPDYCLYQGENELNLGVNYGQLKIDPHGLVKYNEEKDETSIDMTLGINFMFNDLALKLFTADIDSLKTLKKMNFRNKNFIKSINMMIGAEAGKKMMNEIELFGKMEKYPKELNHTLLLSNVKFKWSPLTKSFRSEGPISIVSVKGNQIYKQVKGRIEMIHKRSGDIFHMWFQLNQDQFYMFSYTRGNLLTFSDNKQYIGILKGLKVKERKMKVGRGKIPFIYMVSTEKRRRDVERRLGDNYLKELQEQLDKNKPAEEPENEEDQKENNEAIKEEEDN